MKTFILSISLISYSLAQSPTVYWVDSKSGNDSNNGLTQGTAFKTVQYAFESNNYSAGDTIKIMPSLDASGNLSYYDFGGDELRNLNKNFILVGVKGPDSTIFDAESKNRHMTIEGQTLDASKIIGITFRNGKSTEWPGGGSMHFSGTNIKIKFENCVWESNYITQNEGGGAVNIRDGATPSFTSCIFKNNYADHSDNSQGNGGAVNIQWANNSNELNDAIIFKKTQFINNFAKSKRSSYGGAVATQRSTTFENCLFINNKAITTNDQGYNWYSVYGGALYSNASLNNTGGTLKVINSTFSGNTVETTKSANVDNIRGASISVGGNKVTFYFFNSVASNNKFLLNGNQRTTDNNDAIKHQVFNFSNADNQSNMIVNYSNVEGSAGKDWADTYTYDVVPVFNDTSQGDYSLSNISPLIGAGVANWSSEGLSAPTDDILGNSRPNPSGSNPDIGAYENANGAITAPLPVSGFIASRGTSSAVLKWNRNKSALGSNSDAAFIQYQIYKDGANVAQTTNSFFTLTGLTNGTSYSIQVSAKNTSTGIEGAKSKSILIKPRYLGPKWYVAASNGYALNDTASNFNTGSSTRPLSHIKNAMSILASGDTIVLQGGTHSGSSNRNISLPSDKSFVLMGDPSVNASTVVIDAGERSNHFNFNNTDSIHQIIGLKLINGKTTNSNSGGSITISRSSPIIRNVIFEKNYSSGDQNFNGAGAIYIENGSPTIEGSTFDGNYISSTEYTARGGAIATNHQNSAADTIKIFNNIFKNNHATSKYDAWGGALSIWHSQALIDNNLFHNNYTRSAVNNNFQSSSNGGAVFLYNPNWWNGSVNKPLSIFFRNNTVVNNSVRTDKAGSNIQAAGLMVQGWQVGYIYSYNNLIWGNDIVGEDNNQQIRVEIDEQRLIYTSDYNNIQNFENSDSYQYVGDNTVSFEPSMVDTMGGDYSLDNKSLLIGAGTKSLEGFSAPTKDILGNNRPSPSNSNPDIGAYENSLAVSPYPKPVQKLVATGGNNSVTLTWSANSSSDNVVKYNIYQHTAPFSPSSSYLIGSTSNTTFTISGLDNGTRYYFRVAAVNTSNLEGTASNTINLTPAFSGPIWWVALNGNDNNEGSESNSLGSIAKAVEKASSGDTIIVKPGTYDMQGSGVALNKNIIITSQYPTTWDSVVLNNGPHFWISGDPNSMNRENTQLIGMTLQNGNLNKNGAGDPAGGSVSVYNGVTVTFRKILFKNNILQNSTSTSSAGAVWMSQPGSRFYNCRFEGNKSTETSLGYGNAAGAIGLDGDLSNSFFQDKYLIIEGCEFVRNEGRTEAGAINARHNTKIYNSLFYQNSGENGGSGAVSTMARRAGEGANFETKLIIANCTFVENRCDFGPGAVFAYGGNGAIIFNSIFQNNFKTNSFSSGPEENYFQGSDIKIDYSSFDFDVDINRESNAAQIGSNVILADPAFVDTTKEDFNLSIASILIGRGTSLFEGESAPLSDITGSQRPNPSGTNPDIGAYENSLGESPYPNQTTGLIVESIGSGTINLNWDSGSETNIDKYIIYMNTLNDFIPTSLDSIGESKTNSYTASGLNNGTRYYFRVAPVNTQGYKGLFSNIVEATPNYNGPVWWISNLGSNSNEGSQAAPLADLRSAFDMISNKGGKNDTIKIQPGNYTGDRNHSFESGSYSFQNPESMSIVIMGMGSNPSEVVFSGNEDNYRGFIEVPPFKKVTFQNFTIRQMFNGSDDKSGGAAIAYRRNNSDLLVDNMRFINNRVHQSSYHSGGGAIYIERENSDGGIGDIRIRNSQFINNSVTDYTFPDNNAFGGAICIAPSFVEGNFPIKDGRVDFEPVRIEGCLFVNNNVSSWDGDTFTWGAAIQSQSNVHIENSLFYGNSSDDNHAGVIGLQPFWWSQNSVDGLSGISSLVNNTFGPGPEQKQIYITPGYESGGEHHIYNNIFSRSGSISESSIAVEIQFPNKLWANNNLFESGLVDYNYVGLVETIGRESDLVGDARFRNIGQNDYSLLFNSPAIDAGITEIENNINAPKEDIRGFYRVGSVDIGAFEFGASKYLLSLSDDCSTCQTISGNRDTTFVNLGQEVSFTLETKDIDGNLVNSNEDVNWNVYPSQKYISIIESDDNTSGGTASVKLKVTNSARGKGFKFRVESQIGTETIFRSELYVVEQIVTGAPPAVMTYQIKPSNWSSNNQFSIEWENPNWQRDLLGLNIEIRENNFGFERFDYVEFPSDQALSSHKIEVQESGIYDVSVWLVDELGNDNPSTKKTLSLKYDNEPPQKFYTLYPDTYINSNGQQEITYAPVHPNFIWEDNGDYPSGIDKWHIFLRTKGINDIILYRTFDSDSVTYNEMGEIEVQDTNLPPLNDGFYDWWVEAQDKANLIEFSDTNTFGVDASPPDISHSPINTIDEGTNSPTINAQFFDVASGVKDAFLHYRRSGSGFGFTKLDLLSGPVSIPASDVRAQGIEYFIESEDNIGNVSRWPNDGRSVHSVQVIGNQPLTLMAENFGGNEESDYQLFSFPYDIPNALDAILLAMDQVGYPNFNKKYWRLYAYNGGYEEITDNNYGLFMGEAYFFIWNKDKISERPLFDFGTGHPSTVTDPPFEIYLQPSEWRFFGVPYDFPIPLEQIYTDNGEYIGDVGSLYAWRDGWKELNKGEELMPWQGFIYKSFSANRIIIDGRGMDIGMSTERKHDIATIPMQSDEWTIDIIASTGLLKDDNNTIGVRHVAEDGFDIFDEFEPPMMSGNVALRIDNRNREIAPDLYTVDIRKPSEEGQFWDLQLIAPTNGKRTYVVFDGLGYVPEVYDMFLINKTNRQAISLDIENTYQIANSGSDEDGHIRQDLRLLIGTREFVNENNDGVNLYPDAFVLSQNYPNPFNPQTSIRLSLQEDARVDLIVYDLTGKEVTRLVNSKEHSAGYYNFIWNGKNDLGTRVSSGVYLYHAIVRDSKGSVVLNKTRKMILLK